MSFLKVAVAASFVGMTIVACSGSQGDECTKDSDCKSNLTCQPIDGRDKNYCCPTPAETSDFANCHADREAIARRNQGGNDAGGGG